MTARDSYRKPVSSFEAIQELRRVVRRAARRPASSSIFIEVLAGKDVNFRHGEDADFERELSLEARIEDTTTPSAEHRSLPGRRQDRGLSRRGPAASASGALPFLNCRVSRTPPLAKRDSSKRERRICN